MLDRLGSPDLAFPVLRVVGTNGKGSTCAALEAGLIAAGLRTGCFTSPHLHSFGERIRVQGTPLSDQEAARFIEWAKQEAPDTAFFDLTLGLAAQTLAGRVDWAVMEAGVGGASDATQALARVGAVLLTNVGLDHVGALGQSLADIARDKAGAARPGVPLLTTATAEEGLDTVRAVAEHCGAPLYTPATHPALFELPRPPALAGQHQRLNAALACAALRLLGIGDPDAALEAQHPGRMERRTVGGRQVILDGAHNSHAAQALAASLGHANTLLFGSLARKDTHATLRPLLDMVDQVVFTAPGETAVSPAELAARYGGHGVAQVSEALALALSQTREGGTLLVAGSLYLVAAVRALLDTQASDA
ncbi:bifunctional folylpolyglutamate synthase/dihydrofolate synthase [Deinococcus lacus]|uniref:tetrahydrofolate synthase n=1 Tax=Deinococcus lacus TaxID=392561 RepID=A0ABW1YDA0_9DEIO